MKHLKILFFGFIICLTAHSALAQTKKQIYFLVDTINVQPENRVVDISSKGQIIYTFYCKCLETKQDIVFTYLSSTQDLIVSKKPKLVYTSWKKFLDLVDNDVVKFDEKYELFITEVLPNKKYKTNKVYYDWHREKFINTHIFN